MISNIDNGSHQDQIFLMKQIAKKQLIKTLIEENLENKLLYQKERKWLCN